MKFNGYLDSGDAIYVNYEFNGTKGFRFEMVNNHKEPVFYMKEEDAEKLIKYLSEKLEEK